MRILEYPRPEGLLHNPGFSQVVVAAGTRIIHTAGQVSIDEHGPCGCVSIDLYEGLRSDFSGTRETNPVPRFANNVTITFLKAAERLLGVTAAHILRA